MATESELVLQPQVVNDPQAEQWDAEADVIVVGFGGAGASAAIEAADGGARVIALDAFAGGGATNLSGGIFYAGATPFQREAGFEDTPEEMFKYLSLEYGGVVKDATLRRFCEESADSINWLVQNGLQFEGSFYPNKTGYPPKDKYLYYSGNEELSGYREHAIPAPRGHRTMGKGWTGYAYYQGLRESALAKGVQFYPHSRAVRLLVDKQNAVIGVDVREVEGGENVRKKHSQLYDKVVPFRPFNAGRAERAITEARKIEHEHGVYKRIRSRSGVVLSTGGFVNNLRTLDKHGPIYAKHYRSLLRMGSIGCDGSGITLGESVGGATAHMDNLFVAKGAPTPAGIIVNNAGERFINEENYAAFVGRAIGQQPNGQAWLIVSKAMFRQLISRTVRSGSNTFFNYSMPTLLNIAFGGTRRGRDIETLAARCGISATGLATTIQDYNNSIDQGRQDAFGKSTKNCLPIKGDGFRAINLSVENKFGFMLVMSLGGLQVNEETGQVLRADGSSIAGLYAAGRTAVGLCSHAYFSGMSLADGVFSGRRAGRHCALGFNQQPSQPNA